MTTTVDEFDSALALAATGILRDFNQAGVILAADVHVASRLTTMLNETDEAVALACALVARAVRAGSICLDLTEVRNEVGDDGDELAWPVLDEWLAAIAASPLLAAPHPLRLDDARLYFDRYWREEEQVEQDLRRRAAQPAPQIANEAALVADGELRGRLPSRRLVETFTDLQRRSRPQTSFVVWRQRGRGG